MTHWPKDGGSFDPIEERAGLAAVAIIVLALILFALAYLVEQGFTGLDTGTVIASVATALLLGAMSVLIEQYTKNKLLNQEVDTILVNHQLGVRLVRERNIPRGVFTGMPSDILNGCRREFLTVAYSADNFIERNRAWVTSSLDSGKHIGLLVLHPDCLEQAEETEGRDISSHIQKTLAYCNQLIAEDPARAVYLRVRGYAGHFCFTGILVDRSIIEREKDFSQKGIASVQLKANFKSQHEGLVVTLRPGSPYSTYCTESCRQVWDRSCDLLGNDNKTSNSATDQGLGQDDLSVSRAK